MTSVGDSPGRDSQAPIGDGVRDPLADPAAVLAARARPMAERLELALNWDRIASELQIGLSAALAGPPREP